MPVNPSVSQWIVSLKQGNAHAIQKLWERYSSQLLHLARRRLKEAPKRIGDEEDIALSVFHSLCRGAAAGRFQDVKTRDDLWWLLLAITKQKVANHVRWESAQKRGGKTTKQRLEGRAGDERKRLSLDYLVSEEPSPEFLIMLEDQHDRLLELLRDDSLRQIANFRIEGLTTPEIAENLRLSTRSIERKLKLIRGVWAKELDIEERKQ